jgi:hypothetical protein
MFLECQHATRLWNACWVPTTSTGKIFIYGYQCFDSTAYQLTNFVVIMAKSTIYKTYMASAGEERWTPNYCRLLMMQLKYRQIQKLLVV